MSPEDISLGQYEVRVPQKSHYEAIVVGGGIGGATAAACLASQGLEVLIVDPQPFPRDKTCGDAVNAKALAWLQQNAQFEWQKAGLRPQIMDQFRIVAPNGKEIVLPLFERNGYPYITSRRMDLDNAVHQHALNTGASYRQIQVRELIWDQKTGKPIGVRGKESGNEVELEGDFIIGADGSTSVVAREVGFPPKQKATAIRAYYELDGNVPNELALFYLKDLLPAYAWLFTLSRENRHQIANIGLGFLSNEQYRAFELGPDAPKNVSKLKALLTQFVEHIQVRYPGEIIPDSVSSWQLPIWTGNESRIVNGVPLVGDAGSNVDPLLGEGIAESVITAVLASQYVTNIYNAQGFVGEENAQSSAKSQFDQAYYEYISKSMERKQWIQYHIAGNEPLFNLLATSANRIPPERQLQILRWLISSNNR